ncbi:MAG: ATP-binding protein, partial [Spirochaetales bacterium]|nr:ATP-binding protein [Spirochaetales bacterium]
MKRILMNDLIGWKNSKDRKPLILWGARQVGKTWLMKEFAKTQYKNSIYVSFFNNTKAAKLFDEDYDAKRILSALEITHNVKIDPSETLIIFDEIQAAPKVLESLKYFCEDAREYNIIAAGSLLGVALHSGVSFPVGKVNELHLYPMSFAEFLIAVGEHRLAELLSDFNNEMISDLRDSYIPLLKEYYFVGGMPEVVKCYAETKDFDEVRSIQQTILSQYDGDFGKHIQPEMLPRIRMVWNALPMQLAKENKKFFFGQIKDGARMKDFELAIQWLSDAGLIYKVHKVTKPAVPLKSYVDFAAFKIYMVDVGLLAALSELDKQSIIDGNSIFTEFKGALTEQFVMQEIKACSDYSLFWFSGEKSTFETDFLIQNGKDVLPIEVKAEENLKSKSLRTYYDKFQPVYAIRTSMSGLKKQDWMINIPLWAIGSINRH